MRVGVVYDQTVESGGFFFVFFADVHGKSGVLQADGADIWAFKTLNCKQCRNSPCQATVLLNKQKLELICLPTHNVIPEWECTCACSLLHTHTHKQTNNNKAKVAVLLLPGVE